VVVRAVVGSFDMNPTNSLDSISLLVLVQVMRAACSAPCGLQQGVVRTPPIVGLVQEDVEGLLIDACLRELHLAEEESVTQQTRDKQTTHCSFKITEELSDQTRDAPLSASSRWHKQWRCSTLQQSYVPGRKRTNNRSHPRSRL